MKKTNILTSLFGLLFPILLCTTVIVGVAMKDIPPMTAGNMKNAELETEQLMSLICSGDSDRIHTELGLSPADNQAQPTNALSAVLWEAYFSSLSYEFQGPCYSNDRGLYRDVTVTMLDIPALMKDVQLHALIRLASKAEEDPQAAFDKNGEYTQTFIMDTLAEEVHTLLHTKDYTATQNLTLHLTGRGGHWNVENTPQLIQLVSGTMGGA